MQLALEEENPFRFETRQEYEEEMKRLISMKLDEQYESLVEEYLNFVSQEDGGE